MVYGKLPSITNPADRILDRSDANRQRRVLSYFPNSHLRLTSASFCSQLQWPNVGEVSRTSVPPVLFRAPVRRHRSAQGDRSTLRSIRPTRAKRPFDASVEPTDVRNRPIVQAARQAPSESLPPGQETCYSKSYQTSRTPRAGSAGGASGPWTVPNRARALNTRSSPAGRNAATNS